MPNIFWYIILAVIALVSAAFSIYKNRNKYQVSTLLVFYLCRASLAWMGEFLVLGLFDSYAYKVGVFSDIWEQNLLGHLILNTTLYPSVAVIMVACSLKYGWITFVAVIFTSAEYLFVHLGIYEQHWWKYYMTTISTITFLLIASWWFSLMNQRRYGIVRALSFFFVAMIVVHTPAPILMLMGKQYYKLNFVSNIFIDVYRSSIAIIFAYHLIEAILLVIFTCVLKKWYFKLLPFVISITTQCVLLKMGILVMEDNWSILYTLFIYETFIAIYILLEKYTLRPE